MFCPMYAYFWKNKIDSMPSTCLGHVQNVSCGGHNGHVKLSPWLGICWGCNCWYLYLKHDCTNRHDHIYTDTYHVNMVSYFEKKTARRAFFAQAHQNTMTHRTETENIKVAHCMQNWATPLFSTIKSVSIGTNLCCV